jgi:hypothetical protein
MLTALAHKAGADVRHNEQNPQNARWNNFPGEQIAR